MRIGVFNDADRATLDLNKALLIYSNGIDAACTMHRVDRGKSGKYTIAEGVPVDSETIVDLANRMQGTSVGRTELLPPNLLALQPGLMSWYVPSRRARMYFETKDKTFNADVTGREVLHPATLFVARRDLRVFALPTNERPTMETKVYVAPYFNLYESGSMCAGDHPLPGSLLSSSIPQWERAFYETNFSHTNINLNKLTSHPNGHNALWREMAKTRLKEFPAKYLLPATNSAGRQLTVEEVLSSG
jgi:PRTRC genetic system protein B